MMPMGTACGVGSLSDTTRVSRGRGPVVPTRNFEKVPRILELFLTEGRREVRLSMNNTQHFIGIETMTTTTTKSNLTTGEISAMLSAVRRNGPTRVVTSPMGQVTIPEIARENFNEVPSAILVRDDGWSLGFTEKYRAVAVAMWAGDWIAEIDNTYGGDVIKWAAKARC